MNKAQMNEAMQISRNFAAVNLLAKEADGKLKEIRMSGSYFTSPEDVEILRGASEVLDRIRAKTSEYEAVKYAANTLTENPALT